MENPYSASSNKIMLKKCPFCGKDNEVLESYAHYLIRYIQLESKEITLICQHCKKGVITI